MWVVVSQKTCTRVKCGLELDGTEWSRVVDFDSQKFFYFFVTLVCVKMCESTLQLVLLYL